MKVSISKLDPTGVEEQAIQVQLSQDSTKGGSITYHRYLIEIDGIKYMLTKDSARIV